MSKKISEMPAKLSMIDADEFTILDSADPAPETKNKRVLKSAALAGKQDLVDNTGQTYLGQSEGWTQAGDSATRNVGALSTDVAAGDAPNNSVAAHNSAYNHANLPTTAEKQGLDNAPTAPSSINPYVTEADVPAGTTLHAELTDLATSGHPGSVISITGGGTGNAVTIAADDSLQDAGFAPDAAGTARPPTAHAASHMGGADPVTPAGIGAATAAQGATADTAAQPGDDVATFGSGAAADTHVPLADGVGGISWGAQTPGTGTTLHAELTDLATSGHPGSVISITGGGTGNAVTIAADDSLQDASFAPEQSGAAATVQGNLNTHKTSADHDGRYYTETEIDAIIAGIDHAGLPDTATDGHPGAAINIPAGVQGNAVAIAADSTLVDSGVPPGGAGGSTNLATTYTSTTFTVTSSTGTNALVAQSIAAGNAGAMSGADKTKLDGIAAGAQVNTVAAVNGVNSISVAPTTGTPVVSLQGDAATPGNAKYWGTDGAGAKGFHDLPAGGGGHTIQDEGVPLTVRTNLNFVGGGVTAADDSGNDATTITIPAASVGADIALDGYTEQGSVDSPVTTGNIDIPQDGRIYEITLTGAATLRFGTVPAAPVCGSTVVYINPNGQTLAFESGPMWAGGAQVAIGATKTRYTMSTTPGGTKVFDGEVLATP